MPAYRTGTARPEAMAPAAPRWSDPQAPRTALPRRQALIRGIGFALTLLLPGTVLPAVGGDAPAAPRRISTFTDLDRDANGVEDVLDRWRAGAAGWDQLRAAGGAPSADPVVRAAAGDAPPGVMPADGPVAAGRVRVLCLGSDAGALARARAAAKSTGVCAVLQESRHFGGFAVLDVDAAGLGALLAAEPGGRLLLDRDGVPALVDSRPMIGVGRVASGELVLGDDWSATVAILDSGVDTAHGDLGDATDDDFDGPAPAVGDAADWFDAAGGWPLFAGYKVVGWHDVTDDFPAAAGPWDYNNHGTALAGVVAGSGRVDPDYRGVAPGARLTVVKYYDYDGIWHAWAGDFLAACAWLLDHHETYRVRTVLFGANWDVDAGIGAAVAGLVDAGLLPVAPVGNGGEDPAGPGYPARLPDVLAVGAVDAAGAVSAYSTRGLPGQDKPDLVAPGGGLLPAAGRIVTTDNEPNDTYSGRFGTSLAAAHVAGAAYLLDEALVDNGMAPGRNRTGVAARRNLLRLATAHVAEAETPDGTATKALPAWGGHDPARGWGHLRIDTAVHGLLDPLLPGQDVPDTLSSTWAKPVLARRLIVSPGVRYLVEAVPAGSLDVGLEVVRIDGATGEIVGVPQPMNASGAGVSEFAYHEAAAGEWCFVVVRRLAGAGGVTLRLRDADVFTEAGGGRTLPGLATGAPNAGNIAPWSEPSLVFPSRVLVDPAARSLGVTDLTGTYRAGWPVFVFPPASSQGGLTQPMVADIDGVPGDEIVASSDFGTVYFFDGAGNTRQVVLAFNRRLSRAVGVQSALGGWRVLVVDREGTARTWSWNASVGAQPEQRAEAVLGHLEPLAPACGTLTGAAGEQIVIAFADGWVGAFDSELQMLPGWPVDLGVVLEAPPVLVDLDEDRRHEVVVPVRDPADGRLVMRVLEGDGTPGTGDGAVVAPPGGGRWTAITAPAVAGRYGSGELNVAVAGLVDNDLVGVDHRWSLALGSLSAGGAAVGTSLAALDIRATTAEGVLELDGSVLGTPLAWDQAGDPATEVAGALHLRWNELLYGLTSIPGGTTGWWTAAGPADPLLRRSPRALGGAGTEAVAHLAGMIVPLGGGLHLRADVRDDHVDIIPTPAGDGDTAVWGAARGDGRNSGAYPLRPLASAAPVVAPVASGVQAWPNPSGGRIRFAGRGAVLPADARVDVYDLRGHRVRRIDGADAGGVLHWDGRDGAGRRLAAGAYLAVVRAGGQRFTTRVVLTR